MEASAMPDSGDRNILERSKIIQQTSVKPSTLQEKVQQKQTFISQCSEMEVERNNIYHHMTLVIDKNVYEKPLIFFAGAN